MIFRRIYLEWKYFTKRPWTLNEVGKFWDQVDDYDDINARLYPYYQRFINSKKIFFSSVKKDFKPKKMLDIQTRTGKGTIFWKKEYPNVQCFIADFSKVFLKKTKINLKKRKINFQDLFVQNLPLPYKSKFFDLIVCYETLEHVYEYEDFVRELTRVANHKCKIIITTPNISWEIIHWITAIVGFNHSEGPHRFLSVSYTHLRAHRQEAISYAVFCLKKKFFLMIRRPPRSTLSSSSAASDVYKRQPNASSAGAHNNLSAFP